MSGSVNKLEICSIPIVVTFLQALGTVNRTYICFVIGAPTCMVITDVMFFKERSECT